MGAGPSSSGGGDTGPANRYSTPKKKVVDFIKDGGVTGMVVRSIKKSAAKSKAKKEANVEMGLGTDKMSNYSTSQGGTKQEGGGSDNNNNQTVETPLRTGIFPMPKIDGGEKAIILPPTTSEDTIEKRKKKTKATGRSKSIMTSAKGVTKTSSDYSLGKPSLLGQV